jgi:hypothetical protein
VDRWWSAALVVLVLGVAVQGPIALASGWIPSGDNGFWAVMARSVFSADPPLLGSSSSGGLTTGTDFHHPGPLGFYLLAPFVGLLGGVGLALGAAIINAASVGAAAVAVDRHVGRWAGWSVVVGGALLAFTMGSELLVDPWNPHLATLPLWCACACAWAVLYGGVWWAVPGVVAASLSFQTHLSFVPSAAVLVAVLLVGTAVACSRSASADEAGGGAARHRGGRWAPLVGAGGALLVVNLPVMVQQVFGPGPGNLTSALAGSAQQGNPIGVARAARTVSLPLLGSDRWGPDAWFPQMLEDPDLPSPWRVAVVIAVGIVLVVLSARRRQYSDTATAAVATGLVVVGVVVASRLSFRFETFGVPTTLARWAWPVGLFAQLALLDVGRRRWPPQRSERPRPPWLGAVGLTIVVALALVNLIPRDEGSGSKRAFRQPIAHVLEESAPALAELERPLLQPSFHVLAGEASTAALDWLDERGTPVSLDDPVMLRQAGRHRAPGGAETATVLLRAGGALYAEPPAGFEVVASINPVDEADARWYLETRAQVERRLPPVLEQLRADPERQREIGVPDYAELDMVVGWERVLCGEYSELPPRTREVERSVISESDRVRLCSIEHKLDHEALELSVGPPPTR